MANQNDNSNNPDVDEEAEDYITLEFDDGTEKECSVMGIFQAFGEEFIALIPDDENGDVYIYGYKEVSDDEFELVDIEDDEKFNKVAAEFKKIVNEDAEQ